MDKGIKRLIIITGIFAFGVLAGAIYSIKTNPEILYGYFKGLSGGEISINWGTKIITSAFMWAMMFFSAFFKFGLTTNALLVGARGFIDGFSICSILRILGFRGIGLCFFGIFTAPIIIVMAGFSVSYLKSERKMTGEYMIKSVIALLVLLVFSYISALLSGAITPPYVRGIIK